MRRSMKNRLTALLALCLCACICLALPAAASADVTLDNKTAKLNHIDNSL